MIKEYKAAFYLTLLILVVFAGGSIAMTYIARQKNAPPVNPPALTPTPSPTVVPSPKSLPTTDKSLTPTPIIKITQ